MIPPVLLIIAVRDDEHRLFIPIPIVLLWPLLLLALLATGTRAHAIARCLCASRGLSVDVTGSHQRIRIVMI